ncbi:MAG: hypothetical protein FWE49_04755, partial [Synergistaceae bacterium]|nr:hypothetical protein [Synergistaceae bacterium]
MVKYFNVVKSEIKFEIVLYFQNMVAVITDLIVFSLIFLAFVLLNSGMSLANTYNIDIQYSKVLLFMGYFVWTFSSRALTCISAELNFEASNGYLFSKLTSILPIQFLYFAKFIGALFSQLVIMMPVILIAFIFWPTPPINITSILAIGFIVVVDLIGMYGI